MHSLRVRLVVVTAVVALLVLGAMAALSHHVVTRDLEHLVVQGGEWDTRPLRAAAALLGRSATWPPDADAHLARLARGGRAALIAVDDSGHVVASSSPRLRDMRAQVDETGQLTLSDNTHRGARSSAMQLVLRNPASVVIVHDGQARGQVIAVPEPATADATLHANAPIQRVFNRALFLGALAALALALLLLWLFAGRIVGPIEDVTAAARRMAGGDLTARVSVRGRDEVATLARGFNAMADSLAGAQAARQQMTRDVAHELRTPLTTLRAHIEALQDGIVPPSSVTYASLHDDVLLLTRLIGDLESVARSDSGDISLDLVDVSARDVMHAAVAAFSAAAITQGIALRVAEGHDIRVHADVGRLGQILRNLIANALAYTPPGGAVTLDARVDDGWGALSVADTGSGIATEHLPHVFDRFYRADASRSRATGGSGLGLAIVQQLAAAHGGSAHAASEVGCGTTITIRLPLVMPPSSLLHRG